MLFTLDSGQSIGELIYTLFGNLAAVLTSHPLFGNTALQFANQVAGAQYYTDTLSQSTTSLDTLHSVLSALHLPLCEVPRRTCWN